MFFQQSNVIDKRITPRWLDYEKADTVLGAFVVVIGAAAIMMATASAFTGTSEFGHYADGLNIARGLATHITPVAGTIFALLLFDASIVAAMLVLSLILVVSTVIPSIDVTVLLVVFGSVAGSILVVGGAWSWFSNRGAPREPEIAREERANWRMPALVLLERPTWSGGRKAAMYALAGYLVVSIVLLAVKAVELATQR